MLTHGVARRVEMARRFCLYTRERWRRAARGRPPAATSGAAAGSAARRVERGDGMEAIEATGALTPADLVRVGKGTPGGE